MPSYAITGAARGLGYEFVNQLSAIATNKVFGIVRSSSAATNLQQLSSTRKNVFIVEADVSDPKAVLAAAESVGKVTGGSLDVLIHNAVSKHMPSMLTTASGFTPDNPEFAYEAFNETFKTGLYGALWTTNAFLPLIEKGQEKKIIHISTAMADLEFIKITGIDHGVPYAVSKSAQTMLATKYAAELAPKGIKVLALSPGWVDTFGGNRKSRRLEPANCVVPPQMAAFIATLTAKFQKFDPKVEGPIQTEESVRMCLEVIEKLDAGMSGDILSHHGDKNWF
jgi:NAD(P)-dependent dehydrogenase (short-subunit alcohol dehydrogenase family)